MDTIQVYFTEQGFTRTLTLYKSIADMFDVIPHSYISKEQAEELLGYNIIEQLRLLR